MVEGARLESVCASNGTAGSNPVLSAIEIPRAYDRGISIVKQTRFDTDWCPVLCCHPIVFF